MGQANAFALEGLYKGVGGSLFGQVPYGVLTFGSYEMYKKTLLEKLPNVKPAFVYALAAICGDITGSGWLCPSEVVKQQTQAGMYSSTGDAVRGIFQKKGLSGFYQGYAGGLARESMDFILRSLWPCVYRSASLQYLLLYKFIFFA